MSQDNENIFLDGENPHAEDQLATYAQQMSTQCVSDVQDSNSQEHHNDIADVVEFDVDDEGQFSDIGAKIRVIGIGGGGCKAIECMAISNMTDIDLVALNTDVKALARLKSKVGQCNNLRLVQLGPKTTRGLGAGSIPENGAKAAQESEAELRKLVSGCDMVFLTVGLGGGTGTGASPLIARIAKELGVLTVGVATLPFYSEGKRKWRVAVEGKEKLLSEVDSLILIPNQKIAKVYGQKNVIEAYQHSDEILMNAVRGISDLIHAAGDFGGVDFADVQTCLMDKGLAVISIGHAKNSPKSAQEAIENALNNPMLEDCDISGAQGILGNIIASKNLLVNDVETITNTINDLADEDAITKIGTIISDANDDGIQVVLVASGITIENFEYNSEGLAENPNVVRYNELRRHKQAQHEQSAGYMREEDQQTKETMLTNSRRPRLQSSESLNANKKPLNDSRRYIEDEQPQHGKNAPLLEPSPSPRSWRSALPKSLGRSHDQHTNQQPPLSDEHNEDDLRTPAYTRKRKYTNVQRFAGTQAQMWQD